MEQNTKPVEEKAAAVDSVVDVSSSYTCNVCKKVFSTKSNVSKHLQSIHKIQSKHIGSLRCPQENCKFTCRLMSALHQHLRNFHDVHIEEVKLTFSSMSEFSKWKEEEERSSKSMFVAGHGPREQRNGSRKSYLRCHRSGSFTTKGRGKRKLKAQGSCKMNRCCPASMKVDEGQTKVVIHYYKTHCGHGSNLGDVQHLRLTESERALIAGKLSQGITFDHVLDEIRRNNQGKFDRFQLLTRKDLHNIQNSFKLQLAPATKSETDTWETWVKKAYSLGDDSPILYYKDKGVEGDDGLGEDDFLLVVCNPVQRQMLAQFGAGTICIDSTNAITSGDFFVVSVVVVDEYGGPFPAAFCLSNRVDFTTYLCFFKTLHNLFGSISPTVFVSDECPVIYDAWNQVMGEYEKRYLSSWRTEQAWKTMINKIPLSKKAKRSIAQRWLQTLLTETDIEKFYQELTTFLEEMQEDKETRNFATQFQDQFALRPEMWAHCFMGPELPETMGSLENVHRAVKSGVNKLKTFGHLVKCICALEKLVHDRNNIRLAKTSNSAENVLDNIVVEVIEEGRLWEVKIPLQASHRVLQIADSCFLEECNGSKCIHYYSCTCTDYLRCHNDCGHIQTVLQLQQVLSVSPPVSTVQSKEAEKTLDKCVSEKVETILGFLKKGKFDQDILRQMQEQMDIWIEKGKNPMQPLMNTQPTSQPVNASNNLVLLVYPQQASSTNTNGKIPISRYKSPVAPSVNGKRTRSVKSPGSVKIKQTTRNVTSSFDHIY